MITCTHTAIFIVFCAFTCWHKGDGKLISVNNSVHASYQFLRVTSGGEGALPSLESDPAFARARDRKRICKEISSSGFYNELQDLHPVRMKDVFGQLQEAEYSYIFSRIYSRQRDSLRSILQMHPLYEYTNPYTAVHFSIDNPATGRHSFVTEYVFVCVLKHSSSHRLVAKYITREYNVFGDPYMPGRFVLDHIRPEEAYHARYAYEMVSLAEEPAEVGENANLSKLELRYLQTRKHFQPVHKDERDPLCRLTTAKALRKNQHYRLCVAVSRSSYFSERVRYPEHSDQRHARGCEMIKVSFRTQEGRERATGQPYYERMAECRFADKHKPRNRFSIYLSRGYRANQIFVYRRDTTDEKVYPENLSTFVAVNDIKILFEDVED